MTDASNTQNRTLVPPPVPSGPMRIPEFSIANVTRWFRILEAQFKVRNITDGATKFAHALSAVPMDYQIEVPLSTLDAEDYTAFKTVIIDRHEKSKDEIFEDMVARKTIDDRKPSIYLHEVHRAAQQLGVPDDIVRRIFFKSLDPSIAPVVAMNDDMSIDKLGKLADKVAPLGRRASPAYTVNLLSQKEERSRPLERQFQDQRPRAPTPGASKGKGLDLTPFAAGQRPKICRYHLFYGRDAKNCTAWCHWPGKGNPKMASRNRSPSQGGSGRRQTSPHPKKDKAKPQPFKQLAIKGPHSDSDQSDPENT